MTIREEILSICKGLNYEVTFDLKTCEEQTDEILKLFEKLIDEKIHETNRHKGKTDLISLSNSDCIDFTKRQLEALKEELKK